MYELADDLLSAAGYEWYEVSNWARESSQRSRHNLAYWQGTDWWGFGPGAHSHIAGVRFWNVKHPAAYAQRLAAGESPGAGREIPDAEARALESVLLRTRIREGLPVSDLLGEGRHAVAGAHRGRSRRRTGGGAGEGRAHPARTAARRRGGASAHRLTRLRVRRAIDPVELALESCECQPRREKVGWSASADSRCCGRSSRTTSTPASRSAARRSSSGMPSACRRRPSAMTWRSSRTRS